MKTSILFLLLLCGSFTSSAVEVSVTFDPPTAREDGTPVSPEEIAGYNVFINEEIVPSLNIIDPANMGNYTLPGTTTYFVVDLDFGRYTIKMTAIDVDGRASVYSEEMVYVVVAHPRPPKILKVE